MVNVQNSVVSKHAFMPITVRVVDDEEYKKWLGKLRKNLLKMSIKSITNVKNIKKELN